MNAKPPVPVRSRRAGLTRTTQRRRWLPLLALSLAAGSVTGVQTLLAQLAGADDLSFSEYPPGQLTPAAQVRVGRVFIDHERWGFFRLGLLPLLVAEDVQMRVRSSADLAGALAGMTAWQPAGAARRRLELRRLQLTIGGQIQPCLRADRARIGPAGTLDLSTVRAWSPSGDLIATPAARLQMTGSNAPVGLLSWTQAGVRRQCLLGAGPVTPSTNTPTNTAITIPTTTPPKTS